LEELVVGSSGDRHVKFACRAVRAISPLPSASALPHRGERFGRAILGGAISRVAF
jgi:hypothetical protein